MAQVTLYPPAPPLQRPSWAQPPQHPTVALRRLWLHPRPTLATLAVDKLGFWLLPVGLALGTFYLRIIVMLRLGAAVDEVMLLRGALTIFIGWPLAALLLRGCCKALGSSPAFWPLLLMSLWSTLPLTLRGGTQTAYMLLTGHLLTQPGLSGLITVADPTQPLARVVVFLFGQCDLFALWHLLLLGITVSLATALPLRRTGQAVGLYVAVVLLLGVIGALL